MMTIALFNPPPAPQSTVNSDAVLNGIMGEPNDETGEVIADEAETTNADGATEGVEIETVEEVSPEVKTPEIKTPDTEPSKDATEAQPETSEEITESKSEVEKK